MLFFSVVSFLLAIVGLINTVPITPWENYLELGKIERPLGLIVNQSSLAHQHFVVGYLCLHSFMYDTAQDAFELAIDEDPTLVEAHIGRLLGFVVIFRSILYLCFLGINIHCGLTQIVRVHFRFGIILGLYLLNIM
jgi:hypothetical protein